MSQIVEKRAPLKIRRVMGWAAALVLAGGLLVAFRSSWLPYLRAPEKAPKGKAPAGEHAEHNHAGHDHGAEANVNAIKLSPQAQKNIGLKVTPLALGPFERTISIPGIVVERPGRSILDVTAPLTGVVTSIYPILGEAVHPGQKLFEIRITHEELVQAQADFLRTAEELDVIAREIVRLEEVTRDGAIAGKTLLERKYEQQKQLAVQRAQHQALLLHGLTEAQVQAIRSTRILLPGMTVSVPASEPGVPQDVIYQVQELKVSKGQHVAAGDTLAILADHGQLLIQGNAFDKDSSLLANAVRSGTRVSAIIDAEDGQPEVVRDLSILYLSGKVDAESRAYHFYVTLQNSLLKNPVVKEGQEFINWRFKPGQRVQIQVPVERWQDRFVLPVDAIAQDGVETFVFQQNGQNFVRRPVHVEYRDPTSVVIANDGSLFPGDQVAISAAQQLQLQLKNLAGGGVDPHAGHNH